jgi:hypothetical protein
MTKKNQLTLLSAVWAGGVVAAALSSSVSRHKPIENELLYAGEFMCPPAFEIQRLSSVFHGIPLALALLAPILIAIYLVRRKRIYSACTSVFGAVLAVCLVFGVFDFAFPIHACESAIRNHYLSLVPFYR